MITLEVLSLVTAIRGTFAERSSTDDRVGREIRKVLALLERLPPPTSGFSMSNHAVTRHIAAALRAGNESTAGLLDRIAPVSYFLPWTYSYPLRADAPGLGQSVAFAEIVGPKAPIASDRVCLGLTLLGPRTLYPAHRHPAIEIYYVAAGTAVWTVDGVASEHPPSTFVLHPSQAVHSMETHAEPLLAVYSWSGKDVRTFSTYTTERRKEL
jgi:mannose-6-phosphate isomerase-like protein (cupin superfamily)